MTYPSGSSITKSNMITDFNSLVITARNNAVVWSTDSTATNPFHPQNSQGTYVSGDANPLSSSGTASLATSDLGSATITASEVYNAFVGRAQTASRIRTVRLIKYYNRTGYASGNGYGNVWDQTRVGSMASGYAASYSTADFSTEAAAGGIITATGLDTFVSELAAKVTASKDTQSTFSEYYCHSSCHTSCHASRSRR